MTVENNYAIAIATLSDWLKSLAPVFQSMRSKTKTNRTLYTLYLVRALRKLQIIAKNSSRCLFLLLLVGIITLVIFFDNRLKTALNTNKQS